MNRLENALVHALFCHLHHNIDKAIDFKEFQKLNSRVSKIWPGALLVGPEKDDDAAVFNIPGTEGSFVGKMESHCSPGVVRPYDAAATGAGGAMRDIVAMGGRPFFLLDFIGTRGLDEEVLVGPCGFSGKCSCGKCRIMSSKERTDLMVKGIRDICNIMDVFIVGGGFSTSFSDIVPAIVVAIIGKLVTEKPLTKPAKNEGDRIIIIGETGNDGNDTLYRASLSKQMRPAEALFKEEKESMEAALAAFTTGRVNACSDLGAGGIGAAVCESARKGNLGAVVELEKAPARVEGLSPEEVLICETQARYLIQVSPGDVDKVIEAAGEKTDKVAVIGQITGGREEIFRYNGEQVAVIPNNPSEDILKSLE